MIDEKQVLAHLKLQFNISHPSLEECYAYGFECFKSELGDEYNPYTEDSLEYEYWQQGWWAGFYGETPLYEIEGFNHVLEQKDDGPIDAANDRWYKPTKSLVGRVVRLAGAIAATALVGYQLVDMVA